MRLLTHSPNSPPYVASCPHLLARTPSSHQCIPQANANPTALRPRMSVTMMSRLMLNLHRSAAEHPHTSTSTTAQSTSINTTSLFFTSRIMMPSSVQGADSELDSERPCHDGDEERAYQSPQAQGLGNSQVPEIEMIPLRHMTADNRVHVFV